MFKNFFSNTLYIQVWTHQIKVTVIETGEVFSERPLVAIQVNNKGVKSIVAIGHAATKTQNAEVINPFEHPRLLLADFVVGEKLLQWIFHKIYQKKPFKPAPCVVIHPLEKLEGGLTDIERRAFKELALGAGAQDVVVYQGAELSIQNFDFKALKKQEDK